MNYILIGGFVALLILNVLGVISVGWWVIALPLFVLLVLFLVSLAVISLGLKVAKKNKLM